MIRARLSPKAERDLDGHFRQIGADNPEAAERVRRTILNTADLLAQHPELGCGIRNAAPGSISLFDAFLFLRLIKRQRTAALQNLAEYGES
jgi:plasmid stabilization system protein ParE